MKKYATLFFFLNSCNKGTNFILQIPVANKLLHVIQINYAILPSNFFRVIYSMKFSMQNRSIFVMWNEMVRPILRHSRGPIARNDTENWFGKFDGRIW